MKKPKSLDEKIDALTLLAEKNDGKIDALALLVEKGFASVAEDITDIKSELAEFRDETRSGFRDLRTELKSIRRELDELKEKVLNVTGFRKEIDHAFERLAAIEKHLGLNNKIAA